MGCTTSIRDMLTAESKYDLSWKEAQNTFELNRAIYNSDFAHARHLIIGGVNVNCINYCGRSPMIEICRNTSATDTEREGFVRFLLKQGSDVTLTDVYGWPALLYAKQNGHRVIAKLLADTEFRCRVDSCQSQSSYGGKHSLSGYSISSVATASPPG